MKQSSRIKILFAYEKDCGGETKAIENIYKEFKKNKEWQSEKIILENLINTNLFEIKKYFLSSTLKTLIKIKKTNPDLLYSSTFTSALASIILKKKTVFHYHGNRIPNLKSNKITQKYKHLLFNTAHQIIFKKVNLVIFPSHNQKKHIEKKFFIKKSIVIPNSINHKKFYQLNKMEIKKIKKGLKLPDKKILTYLGRLDEKKGINTLIDIVKYLKKYDNKFIVLIDYLRPRNKNEKNILKKIKIIAKNYPQQLIIKENYSPNKIYNISDWLLSFSKIEVFPLTMIEGLACGKLTISTNKEIQNLMSEIDKRIFFKNNRTKEIIKKIESLEKTKIKKTRIKIIAKKYSNKNIIPLIQKCLISALHL